MIDRPMPQSPDAERAALSCILQEPSEWLEEAIGLLPDDSMHLPAHRRLMAVLRDLRGHLEPGQIDLMAVIDALDRKGELETVGGVEYVTQLSMEVATTANANTYFRLVADAYSLRQLISTCAGLIECAYDQPSDVTDLLADATRQLDEVSMGHTGDHLPTVPDVIGNLIDHQRRALSGELINVPWYISDHLDRHLVLRPGTFTVIGARPGSGKTALAVTAANRQIDHNISASFICLEMTNEQIMARFVSQRTGLTYSQIMDGLRDQNDDGTWQELPRWAQDKYMQGLEAIRHRPLHLYCGRFIGIDRCLSVMARQHRRHGCKIYYIDYLQNLATSEKRNNRITIREQLIDICGRLKAFATERQVAVVGFAQLRRDLENRSPVMSDLQESSAMEQYADNIGLLDRPDIDQPGKGQGERKYTLVKGGQPVSMVGKAAMLQPKGRNNQPGGITLLNYDGPTMQFSRYSTDTTTHHSP